MSTYEIPFEMPSLDESRPNTPPLQEPTSVPPLFGAGLQFSPEQLLQAMMSQFAAQTAQLLNNGTHTDNSASRDPRIPDIERFDGNASKVRGFQASLRNFFSAQPRIYGSDQAKICYIISRLDGTAKAWADALLYRNDQSLKSLTEFTRLFEIMFVNPEEKTINSTKLLQMRQGRKSTQQYANEFMILLPNSNIQLSSATPVFYEGLNYETKKMVASMGTLPTDFYEYVNQICALSSKLASLVPTREFTPRPRNPQLGPTVPPTMHPEPMDIDEIRALPREERKRICIERRLCFYCNSPDHAIRNCPVIQNKSSQPYSYSIQTVQVLPYQSKGTLTVEGVLHLSDGDHKVTVNRHWSNRVRLHKQDNR
jgi:hypothetical protein